MSTFIGIIDRKLTQALIEASVIKIEIAVCDSLSIRYN